MNQSFSSFLSIIILFAGFNFVSCNRAKEKQIMDLSNTKWTFHEKGSDKVLHARVPGCVQMDLLANGEIPDPYYRTNEDSLQWIGEKDWVYRTEFLVEPGMFERENLELVFKGLDTYADVYLNNAPVLKADNFFREWRVDTKPLLKEGKNTLEIRFSSPVKVGEKKKVESKIPLEYEYAYTRKPAYHFGWDWGPRFVTSGIWRPVEIEGWGTEKINDFQIYQLQVSEKKADLKAVIQIDSDAETGCDITLLNGNRQIIKKKINLRKGVNKFSEIFQINNPKLWWPNGLGEAYRYNLSVFFLLRFNF